MNPLEDLKQQLTAKIQATSSPELPPSDLDLLNYSQLPGYQAHQQLRQQIERQPPVTNPFYDADASYLVESLLESRVKLNSALNTAEGYRSQVPELATAIADALTGTDQAISVLNDLEAYADGDKP